MKGVILVAMLGTGVIVVANDIKNEGGIHGTHVLALGIVYVGITAANEVSPRIAVPLSLLIFAAVALTKGPGVLDSITKYASSSDKSSLPTYGQDPSTFVPGAVVPPKSRLRSTGPSGISK